MINKIYDTSEPVGNTCPKIDKAIEMMEDLRSDNSCLREWGNDLVEAIEQFETLCQEQKDTIIELEEEIKILKDQLWEKSEEFNEYKRLTE